ncbi:Aaa-atpase [Thalictrum thalictroides]|uniref:Aaa-atpase n=1 Tax=Thalictrum thalictroides TaxID=46969 RepID=A0A7J6XBU2_THATH|nr:Aaa-atpase [Thalictrum thalictroides]
MWGANMGSSIATFMFLYAMFKQYVPYQLKEHIEKYAQRILGFISPYIEITVHEYTGERFKRSEAYIAIKTYLGANSSKQAKRLKADVGKTSSNLVLSMDDYEEVTDEYQGVQFWWTSRKTFSSKQSISFYPTDADDNRFYKLTFHRRHRGLATDSYLNYVLEEGKAIEVKSRQRKLFTNNPSNNWYGYKKSVWSHVVFDHPSTFQTLAMDVEKKKDIIDDLTAFSKGKDFYAKVGKAWKRGYLLYGPPGTGKSTMIAAIANFLDYDIYDLELTGVKDNTELRKLLIETTNKSIVVIEDIDCSLDLTGQRKKKTEEEAKEGEDPITKKAKQDASPGDSKVTLSGLLNFIDGLWSACGGERLIIFTTNYVEKLDPALIRRGRMDKHIELSYCSFGAFKVLAKNYLDLDSHHLFDPVRELLDETQITPADVAENLMPRATVENSADHCLESLIQALKNTKEEARLKTEKEKAEKEEARLKEEKETKERELSNKESTTNEAKEICSTPLEEKESSTKSN